jgi:glycosyltransferase involved in cell wall biosynthesis
MAATPAFEVHNGVQVWHPRYLLPPKVGMNVAPLTLALGARRTLARLLQTGFDFDLIDAHYYYPDGVAAALLARWFGKPLVVTARGTDLTLIPKYALPRRVIQWTERQVFASIGVSRSLMDILAELGGRADRMQVIRNGVDLARFRPLDRTRSRAYLSLPARGRIMLSVGHLIERKGHHVAIESLRMLPDWQLVIVGSGEELGRLVALAEHCGVADRVRFAGHQPQPSLASWYSAADVLVLCSSREGWANVLLESLACGTPVVATRISGTPEVIQAPVAGRLIDDRSATALAAALRELEADYPERDAVRRYAEGFSWDGPTADQLALFRQVLVATGSQNLPQPVAG